MKSAFLRLCRAQSAANTVLWTGFVLLLLAERAARGDHGVAWWVVGVGAVLLAVAGAVIRTHPLVSWLIACVLTFGQLDGVALGPSFQLVHPLVLVVVSYLVGRSVQDVRWPLAAFAVVVSGGLFAVIVIGYLSGSSLPRVANNLVHTAYLVFALMLLGVLPWLVGRYRRLNTDLAAAGWERAQQLEREQEITAERERLRERARIARDMHDSLGHALSLLALRAGVIEVDRAADERLRGFAGDMRRSVTDVVEELRLVIGVLRDDSTAAPSEPAHESVAQLVDRTALSGADVTLEHTGEPVALRPIADRAAYRVVQESLTNATKHAPGAAITVRLGYGVGETVVEVVNAPPPSRAVGAPKGRRGLIGLEERVRIAGGVLTAGPHEGGFRVVAVLPHTEPHVTVGNRPPVAEQGGTRRRIEDEQRRTRRRLTRGLVLTFGLSAGAAALVVGLFALWVLNSVLGRSDYDLLALGTPRAAAEAVLPVWDLESIEVTEPPRPVGASCAYYLTSASILPAPESVYRLCFAGDLLVSKDVIDV